MERNAIDGLDLSRLPTPCYVLDLERLRRNNRIRREVADRSGAQVLLALKAFSCWKVFHLMRQGLDGCCASSLDEARLGAEKFGGEVHIFSPAYKEGQIAEYLKYCSHFSFNSPAQWERFKERLIGRPGVSCGIRINPEHRETKADMYDPCGPGSRLGVPLAEFVKMDLAGVEGLHCHNLCEKYADSFARTLTAVEERFGSYIPRMKWINFGGGHLITSPGYDVDLLVGLLKGVRERYGVAVYIEPGEAHVRDAGVLVAEVVDVLHNGIDIAVLDTSAATHMPDTLEMPYRPEIAGAGQPGEKKHTYRLGGPSCLAGDTIGDYSFDEPLVPGRRLVFGDMAHYTMVKNTTFNGIRLPSILTYEPEDDGLTILREFGYEDFLTRLS